MPRPALALALIRGVHTALYVVMAGAVFAILNAGVTGAAGVSGAADAAHVGVFRAAYCCGLGVGGRALERVFGCLS